MFNRLNIVQCILWLPMANPLQTFQARRQNMKIFVRFQSANPNNNNNNNVKMLTMPTMSIHSIMLYLSPVCLINCLDTETVCILVYTSKCVSINGKLFERLFKQKQFFFLNWTKNKKRKKRTPECGLGRRARSLWFLCYPNVWTIIMQHILYMYMLFVRVESTHSLSQFTHADHPLRYMDADDADDPLTYNISYVFDCFVLYDSLYTDIIILSFLFYSFRAFRIWFEHFFADDM